MQHESLCHNTTKLLAKIEKKKKFNLKNSNGNISEVTVEYCEEYTLHILAEV